MENNPKKKERKKKERKQPRARDPGEVTQHRDLLRVCVCEGER